MCWDLNFFFFHLPSVNRSSHLHQRPGDLELLIFYILSHKGEQVGCKSLSLLSTSVQVTTGKNVRYNFLFSHQILFQFSILVYKTTPKVSGFKQHFVFLMVSRLLLILVGVTHTAKFSWWVDWAGRSWVLTDGWGTSVPLYIA